MCIISQKKTHFCGKTVHFWDGWGQFGKPPKKLEKRFGAITRGFEWSYGAELSGSASIFVAMQRNEKNSEKD